MKVKFDLSGLSESKWYEYALRFAFGGGVTALTGLVAKRYGPAIGGLFLAFPAIFPATATLLEDEEKEKKKRVGVRGTTRGRRAAGVDAAGAAMGAIGLIVFALVVWQRLPHTPLGWALLEATTLWLVTSIAVWLFRETWKRALRRKLIRSHVSLRGHTVTLNRRNR